MSFHKKSAGPAAPALALKHSGGFGKLPSDAIVGMDRRDLPPSLRRGTSGLNSSSNGTAGRSVPSYMQGTQTSQRRDIGMNVRRLAKSSEKPKQDLQIKGYGAPTKLPALYEQAHPRQGLNHHMSVSEPEIQQTSQEITAPPYVPLQLAKSREASTKEVQQISKSCRYVRRKGSVIDPPSFYYKR